jgi:hypothetical protein
MSQTHPIIGGIYKHYKSTGGMDHVYVVTGIAKHSETDELLVIYEPLYDCDWMIESNAGLVVRPLEMFMGKLEVNGKILQRFEFVVSSSS